MPSSRYDRAYSRPTPGALYVDERFTPAPSLDLSHLVDDDWNTNHLITDAAEVVAPSAVCPQFVESKTSQADRYRMDAAPVQQYLHQESNTHLLDHAAAELGEIPPLPRARGASVAATDDSGPDAKRGHGVASLQAPGLAYPKPPTVPVPIWIRPTGNSASAQEGLSAQLARLRRSGTLGKITPLEDD